MDKVQLKNVTLRFVMYSLVGLLLLTTESYAQSPNQRLERAVKANNLKKAKRAIRRGADPNMLVTQYQEKAPLLMYAAFYADVQMVKYLVNQKAVFTQKGILKYNKDGNWYGSLMGIAAGEGKIPLLKYLVEELKISVNDRELEIKTKQPNGLTPLHCAADGKQLKSAQYLIEQGASLKTTVYKNQLNVLSYACCTKGNAALLKLLLANGGKRIPAANNGWMPIHYAARYGDLEMVKTLLKDGADINAPTHTKLNPVFFAAAPKDGLPLVKYLLQQGAKLKTDNLDGLSILHSAMHYGSLATVKYLAQKGAGVNDQTIKSWTVLHEAVRYSRHEIVTWLLKQGADPNTLYNESESPLYSATEFSDAKMAALLLKYGGNINQETRGGWSLLEAAIHYKDTTMAALFVRKGIDKKELPSALQEAATNGYTSLVRLIVNQGVAVDVTTSWLKATALYWAAKNGHYETVKTLLDLGASLKFQNQFQDTPLHYAVQSDKAKPQIVKLMLEKGANINARNEFKETCLHKAVHNGFGEMVKLLLKNGANPYLKANEGIPLEVAFLYGKTEAIKLLMKFGADDEK